MSSILFAWVAKRFPRKQKSSRKKRCRSTVHLELERHEDRQVLSTVSFDGGGDGSTWGDADNWGGDVLTMRPCKPSSAPPSRARAA